MSQADEKACDIFCYTSWSNRLSASQLCLSCRMAGFGVSLVGLDIVACRLWRD